MASPGLLARVGGGVPTLGKAPPDSGAQTLGREQARGRKEWGVSPRVIYFSVNSEMEPAGGIQTPTELQIQVGRGFLPQHCQKLKPQWNHPWLLLSPGLPLPWVWGSPKPAARLQGSGAIWWWILGPTQSQPGEDGASFRGREHLPPRSPSLTLPPVSLNPFGPIAWTQGWTQ